MAKNYTSRAGPEQLKRLFSEAMERTDPEKTRDLSATQDFFVERPGSRIGPYHLLDILGEGGMGIVYLAEQKQPIRRRVAFKVIKPGMDSARIIARFEAERQALALLDHPNIARVHDAGTTASGRPYFVMELVKGVPIIEYCDREALDTSARLDLFIEVCHAIQHAHQKGIIHRDLKPTNILVSTPDEQPVPKIIDFGIAKAISQPLTDSTIFTEQGQLIGTPEYMSPEQAEMGNQDVDTRSDIYSLGVLLYELLTGSTPFDTRELMASGFDEMRKIIREREPVKPSTRLSQFLSQSEASSKLATGHSSLATDLDWIVLKCLEKDRTRRYETANSLVMDIRRHLANELIVARPPSPGYRLRKAWRRNRLAYSAIGAVVVALAVGLGVSLWQAAKTEQERGRARRNAYVSDMGRVAQAWETGDLSRARALLDRHRPQSNGFHEASFEWRLLWGLAHEDKTLFDLQADAKPVASVALSAQGRFLAWCDGGIVRLVDLKSPHESFMLPASASGIHSLAFSAKGQWLATGRDDGLITLWNVPTWTEEASLEGHGDKVTHLAFHPDEERLVSLGADETVRIWDLTDRAEVVAYESPEKGKKLSFSADGRLLAAFGGLNNTVRFYSLEPNLPLHATLPPQKGIILSVELAADAESAIISAHDSSVTRWDLAPLQFQMPYGEKILVTQMALSADGRILATAGGDNLIKVWDVASGQELRVLRGHTAAVSHLCLSADGSALVSADADNRVKVWTTDPTRETNVLTHEGIVVYTAVAPEGGLLATSNPNFFVVDLWDLRSGAAKRQRFINDAKAEPAFSPDGKWLALRRFADPNGNEVELWDRSTTPYRRVQFLPSAYGFGHLLRFSPDSRILVFRAPGEVLELWDTVARQSLGQLPDHTSSCGTAFSSDGELIATGCRGQIRIWHVRSQRLLAMIEKQHRDIRSLCFSSDDNMLMAASGDAEVRRWDVTNPEAPHPLPPLRGHTAFVHQIALSPDGKILASAGNDSTVRLWDPLSGEELVTLRGHSAVVACVAWSPDGQSLYTGSGDATVRIWRAPSWKDIEQTQGSRLN